MAIDIAEDMVLAYIRQKTVVYWEIGKEIIVPL